MSTDSSHGDSQAERTFSGVRAVNDTPTAVDALKCNICKELLYAARQSIKCGHRFCTRCLTSAISDANKSSIPYKCPACDDTIADHEHFPDAYAEREVMALDVFCAAAQQGCQWQGKLKTYRQHQLACPYMLVQCPNKGCNALAPRHELEHHQKTVCIQRQISCENCGDDVSVIELDQHIATVCPKAVVVCKHGCGMPAIMRTELNEHYKVCPRMKVKCYYSGGGCEFFGPRSELPTHHNNNIAYHMQVIHQISEATRQGFSDMRQQWAEQRVTIAALSKTVDRLVTESKEQQQEIKNLKQETREFQQQVVQLEKISADQQKDIDNERRARVKLEKKIETFAIPTAGAVVSAGELRSNGSVVDDVSLRHFPPHGNQPCVADSHHNPLQSIQSSGIASSSGLSDMNSAQSRCQPLAILPQDVQKLRNANEASTKRLDVIDRHLAVMDIQLSDLSIRQDLTEVKGMGGVLIWRIADIRRRLKEAETGRTLSLYSPPFYTSQSGYKMCARIYLNGDGAGKASHMSLFFVVMRGDFDPLLPWPFQQRVKMALLDQTPNLSPQQRSDVTEMFKPSLRSSSFQRPSTEMNIATGCPQFAPKSVLSSERYVQADTIFIKLEVSALGSKAPDYVHTTGVT